MAKKKQIVKAPSLRDEFMKLNKEEQDKAIHFFNLHNAANWVFLNMADETKQYVNYCISLSQGANNIERKHKNDD